MQRKMKMNKKQTVVLFQANMRWSDLRGEDKIHFLLTPKISQRFTLSGGQNIHFALKM